MMKKEIDITVENKLTTEKRDLNIYHHSGKSSHIIGHNSSITLPLKTVSEDDYMHISVACGPGRLTRKSVISLPSWVDFECSSEGHLAVTHSGERMLLKIPPGPPTWQLKMIRPVTIPTNRHTDLVTVSEDRIE